MADARMPGELDGVGLSPARQPATPALKAIVVTGHKVEEKVKQAG